MVIGRIREGSGAIGVKRNILVYLKVLNFNIYWEGFSYI